MVGSAGAVKGAVGGVVALVGDEGVGVGRRAILDGRRGLLLHLLLAVVVLEVVLCQGLAERQLLGVTDACQGSVLGYSYLSLSVYLITITILLKT